jgi:hypothetical protein
MLASQGAPRAARGRAWPAASFCLAGGARCRGTRTLQRRALSTSGPAAALPSSTLSARTPFCSSLEATWNQRFASRECGLDRASAEERSAGLLQTGGQASARLLYTAPEVFLGQGRTTKVGPASRPECHHGSGWR